MYETLLVIFLIVVIALITLIMIQNGKGTDIGASYRTDISSTLFGSSGSVNFITRATALLATLFFVVSLALANISNNNTNTENKWENLSIPEKIESAQLIIPDKSIVDVPS